MRKLTYLAVSEPTDTGYSVYFPDLPGCISVGSDFENASRRAADALGLHIYGIEKDGERCLHLAESAIGSRHRTGEHSYPHISVSEHYPQ
jgi:predicted RNase H-like HicB family nuclease